MKAKAQVEEGLTEQVVAKAKAEEGEKSKNKRLPGGKDNAAPPKAEPKPQAAPSANRKGFAEEDDDLT